MLHVITGLGCPDAWQWIDTESPNIFVVSVGSVTHAGATVFKIEKIVYQIMFNGRELLDRNYLLKSNLHIFNIATISNVTSEF